MMRRGRRPHPRRGGGGPTGLVGTNSMPAPPPTHHPLAVHTKQGGRRAGSKASLTGYSTSPTVRMSRRDT